MAKTTKTATLRAATSQEATESGPIAASKHTQPDMDAVLLKLDYEETGRQYRMLADMRFKLLAITPALLGAGLVGALGGRDGAQASELQIGIGLLGFFVTVGLVLFELRNTELYDAALQRLRWLDAELRFPSTRSSGAVGGVHGERPGRELRLFRGVPNVHEYAQGLVYAATLGGWAFVFVHGATRTGSSLPIVLAVVFAALVLAGFLLHDHRLEQSVRSTAAPHGDPRGQ